MTETEPSGAVPRYRRLTGLLALALDRTGQVVGSICLVIILVLVSIQVLQRATTGGSWAWSGEIAKYAMVWSTFILSAHLLRSNGHLQIDIIEQWLRPRGERVVTRITDALIAVTCAGLTWAGWGLLTAPFLGSAPASRIPLVVVYAVPVLGLLFTTLIAIGQAVFGRDSEFSVKRPTPAAEGAI